MEDYIKLIGFLKDNNFQHDLEYIEKNIEDLISKIENKEIKSILHSCTLPGGASPLWQFRLKEAKRKEEELNKKFLEKGIVVRSRCDAETLEARIHSVKLNFTNDQWVDLLNSEGEFLPACCNKISAVRDILSFSLRGGKEITLRELKNAVELIESHCEGGELNECEKYIVNLWNEVKDYYKCNEKPLATDFKNFKKALSVVEKASYSLYWTRGDDEERKLHTMYDFARMLPALKTIFDHLKSVEFPELTCYVVFYENEILETLGGPAICEKKEQAEYIVSRNKDINLVVKQGVLSVEKGLVFNDVY